MAGHPIARSTGYNETITQINKSGGVAAANGVDVPVDNIPGYFKLLPELTVTPAAGAPVTVQCSGKSANASTNTYKFLGCVPAGSVAAPATVSATVEGVSVSTNLVTWSGGEMTVGATEELLPEHVLGPEHQRHECPRELHRVHRVEVHRLSSAR